VKRLVNQLVGDIRSVVLGRVDVVDAELHRSPQPGEGFSAGARRPKHPRSGQLHRTEPDPSYRAPHEAASIRDHRGKHLKRTDALVSWGVPRTG
jgi:hypothetical protein